MRHDDNLHQNLRRKVGSARNFKCVRCGEQAYEWAFQHNGPVDDPNNYSPMCRSCHRKLDLENSPVLRSSWERSRNRLTREQQAMGGRAAPHPGRPLTPEEAASMGHSGGTARSRRMKEDSEMRARMVEVAKQNLPSRKRRCQCGKASSAAGIGNHQKSTGHQGYEEI